MHIGSAAHLWPRPAERRVEQRLVDDARVAAVLQTGHFPRILDAVLQGPPLSIPLRKETKTDILNDKHAEP